jgi:hypothetical protein
MFQMRKSIGVSGMGWLSQRASKRALACLAVFGVGGVAGLLAGFSTNPVQTSELSSELSPAEIVAMRFPGHPNRVAQSPVAASPSPATASSTAPSAVSSGYVLASADETDLPASDLMFSPIPTYSSPARQIPVRSSLPPQLVTASVPIPGQALAYAAPEADLRAEPVAPAARPEVASIAPMAVKRAVPPPPHPATPSAASSGPASPSNAVLNNAQIASIRERLKLSSYQSQLWPQVESALRDISWQGHADASHKTAANPRGATIDPNSVPVQRLKSAAFPLIMSLSEDQKQEVRSMVRLMGLENLASQF